MKGEGRRLIHPEDLGALWREREHIGGCIPITGVHLSRLDCQTQPLFALAKFLLRLFASGYILDRTTKLDDTTRAIPPHFALGNDQSSSAVGMIHFKVEFVRSSRAKRFFHGALQAEPAFGGVEL